MHLHLDHELSLVLPFEEHVDHVNVVLEALLDVQLVLNLSLSHALRHLRWPRDSGARC